MQYTKEDAVENLARVAWLLSDDRPGDITGLAIHIAETAGGAWGYIRDMIVDGLRELSTDDQTTQVLGIERGIATLDGVSIYWWHSNTETCWADEKPDWWDD